MSPMAPLAGALLLVVTSACSFLRPPAPHPTTPAEPPAEATVMPATAPAARVIWRSPTATNKPGSYYCHSEGAMKTGASMCRPALEDCEDERKAATDEGFTTSNCTQVTPVACFHIGGDGDLAFEWCAGSMQDCRLWLRMDEEKHGAHGEECQFKH